VYAKDIQENAQLKARDYWVNGRHPELCADITYPGAFAKLSELHLHLINVHRLIGEHNSDIYERN